MPFDIIPVVGRRVNPRMAPHSHIPGPLHYVYSLPLRHSQNTSHDHFTLVELLPKGLVNQSRFSSPIIFTERRPCGAEGEDKADIPQGLTTWSVIIIPQCARYFKSPSIFSPEMQVIGNTYRTFLLTKSLISGMLFIFKEEW